jgi:hypothetical protein
VTRTGLFLAAALLAGAFAPRAAHADGIRVVDLTPSFPAGPYLGLTVDPRNPDRIAVATADGRVGWGEAAGARTAESRVVSPREYVSAPLRARPALLSLAPTRLAGRSALSGLHGEPPGTRLFLWLLKEERPVARWQYWMSVENPRLEIYDVTIPAPGRPALAAGAAGLFRGDRRADGWIQSAGAPAPRGATLSAYAVTVDPERPAEAFAGTSAGLLVSHDGGRTFAPHRDPELAGVDIRRFVWDRHAPGHLLALAPRAIYQSRDGGVTFVRSFADAGGVSTAAVGPDGAYVATRHGVIVPGLDHRLFPDDAVVGVVPLGAGVSLIATESALVLHSADDGDRVLRRAPEDDPFLRLEGSDDAAWLLTSHAILRVTAAAPLRRAAVAPPRLLLPPTAVDRAALARVGLTRPVDTRLGLPWYAYLLPRVTIDARRVTTHGQSALYDALYPFPERIRTAESASWCCGAPVGAPGPELLALATWDLSGLLMSKTPTYPYSIIEMNLRAARDQVLNEVRRRYDDAAHLVRLLATPPDDPAVRWLWTDRLNEQAAYLEAMTGERVIELEGSNPNRE